MLGTQVEWYDVTEDLLSRRSGRQMIVYNHRTQDKVFSFSSQAFSSEGYEKERLNSSFVGSKHRVAALSCVFSVAPQFVIWKVCVCERERKGEGVCACVLSDVRELGLGSS
jgi:hypothetical protein